jgi:septum formation protein
VSVAFFYVIGSMQLSKPVILASQSPRRLLLLRQIGVEPIVRPCSIAETVEPDRSPARNAQDLAIQKARTVAAGVEHGYVVGADTIVTLGSTMLGKPTDYDDAVRMLGLLSGKTHTVHTGYAIIDRPSNKIISGVEETLVTFRSIPKAEIEEYVAGGSPMDKAGAYGIQDDYGAVFVRRIEGCYYNVVGLPLSALYEALMKIEKRSLESTKESNE